jgi:HAE1 family hydrophobic/amphiphilic exporter-1
MYAVGLPVIWGMTAASILGVLLIPMLYVVFQRMREIKLFGKGKPPEGGAAAEAPPAPAGH